MKAFCKVIKTEPVVSGTSDNGNDWERQTVILETMGVEPQTLAVDFMGERRTAKTKSLQPGQEVEVTFAIRCNEFAGKWFTKLEGYSIAPLATMNPPAQPAGNDDIPY